MPELNFQIESAEAVPYAAAPTLAFKLRVTQQPIDSGPPAKIHSVMLRCQLRIEPGRRRYAPREQEALHELFGEPHRWGQTVRSMLWSNASLTLPAFTDEIRADLPIACTFDFNIAATKLFAALDDGQIPLSFLFSGTIFYAGDDESASLQVAQISWEKEATFRLDVAIWRKMMDLYFPNTVYLGVRQDLFDRLNDLRRRHGGATVEQVLEKLLDGAEPPEDIAPDAITPPIAASFEARP
jgi:hypothetical protein